MKHMKNDREDEISKELREELIAREARRLTPIKELFELEKLERLFQQKAEYSAMFKPEMEQHYKDMVKFCRARQLLMLEIAIKRIKRNEKGSI